MHRSTKIQVRRLAYKVSVPVGLLGEKTWADRIQGLACAGALWYWRQLSAAGCCELAHGVIAQVKYEERKKKKRKAGREGEEKVSKLIEMFE